MCKKTQRLALCASMALVPMLTLAAPKSNIPVVTPEMFEQLQTEFHDYVVANDAQIAALQTSITDLTAAIDQLAEPSYQAGDIVAGYLVDGNHMYADSSSTQGKVYTLSEAQDPSVRGNAYYLVTEAGHIVTTGQWKVMAEADLTKEMGFQHKPIVFKKQPE